MKEASFFKKGKRVAVERRDENRVEEGGEQTRGVVLGGGFNLMKRDQVNTGERKGWSRHRKSGREEEDGEIQGRNHEERKKE